jgi:hypothetical protein
MRRLGSQWIECRGRCRGGGFFGEHSGKAKHPETHAATTKEIAT